MSGGIADTLAAHPEWRIGGQGVICAGDECEWSLPYRATTVTADYTAHQAEVLSSAGYGDLSALLDDLRGLADQWQAWPEDDPVTRPWDGKILARIVDRHTPARKDS